MTFNAAFHFSLRVCSGASDKLGEGVNFSIYVGFAQAEDKEP